jgi:hypothetical protein
MVYLYMPDQTPLILYFRKKQITPNPGGFFFLTDPLGLQENY